MQNFAIVRSYFWLSQSAKSIILVIGKLKSCFCMVCFYLFRIKKHLKRSLAYKEGEMSISQRRGTITLIPKEDSNLLHLSNWRPITLLNLDYKIVSKAIAKRFERVLKRVINPDQTGFIKDRYISAKTLG